MKWVSNVIITVSAIVLLTVGIYLSLIDKASAAVAPLGIGFLFVVLTLLAKFKRFKGFGFEAEMWEEKQTEAAVLVEQLTFLSRTVSQQVALFASKLGLWGSALTLPELAAVIDQTTALSDVVRIPTNERDIILEPVYKRVRSYYLHIAETFYSKQLDREKGSSLEVQNAHSQWSTTQFKEYRSKWEISFLVDLVKKSGLSNLKTTSKELIELDRDLKFLTKII